MPACRRSISPRGSVSNTTPSSRKLRTGLAAFQLKSWRHGPPHWVLNRRHSLSICCCIMSRNYTGYCSEQENECGCVRAQTERGLVERNGAQHHGRGAERRHCVGRRPRMGNRHDRNRRCAVLSAGSASGSACELCVSRIGGRYILEDGSGRFLFEHQSLALVALHAKAAVQSMRGWLVARAVLLWCTIRHLIHDKVEPLLTEGEELLVELAPQLAAFA